MFLTHEDGKSPLPESFFEANEHCWNYVTLDIWLPWYLATVEFNYDIEHTFVRTLFLHRTEQLEGLAQSTDRTLIRLQVVQPCTDKRRGWQLEDVLGITKISAEHSNDFIELDFAIGKMSKSIFGESTESDNIKVIKKVSIWSAKPIAE